MRVERLRSSFAIEVAYRHFPLHPDTPEEGMSLEQLFAGRNIDIEASQAQMSRLMASEGLPYGERTMTYNSRLAQELGKWAETQPGGERIHNALFQAYFVESLNLASIDNLMTPVGRIDLPLEEARQALQERRFRRDVDADWQRSRELGISGVPTFVVGKRGIIGAQPYEQLEAFLISCGAQRREP